MTATAADLLRAAIGKLRLKLLDLSNRNRLLNFKFSDSSRQYVRVIDELPDALYARLLGEGGGSDRLYFEPLPEPDADDHAEEAGADAGATDDPTATPPVAPGATAASQRISLPAWARRNGIDPSFDLPLLGPGVPSDRHIDNKIQTLLLPAALERKVSALRDRAVEAQQELGLATLYVAFGFLEWYESPDSQEPRLSPLFLLPVEIGRELSQRRYRYFIRCDEGAEPLANISLRERLRHDLGFELPAVAEEQTPEQYLAQVTAAVAAQPRWTVRRFVTVGHLSFARLVMYEDLAPDGWANAAVDHHEVIRALLQGAQNGAVDDHAADFDAEEEAVERQVPVLITEADSSQFSAIVDAMQGRSFALKGPPGTGKSQTITNLIAAALASDKRVLFVAEKQAALDVVASRLRDAGLGEFLLELHSTKTQKKRVLQSLQERLALRKGREDAGLDTVLQSLRVTRAQLKGYVTLLNSPVGASELTLHEVFWHEQRARGALSAAELKLAHALEDKAAPQISARDFDTRSRLIGELASTFTECERYAGAIEAHPLFGLRSPGLGPSAEEDTRAELLAGEEALKRLQQLVGQTDRLFECRLPPTLGELQAFAAAVMQLPEVGGNVSMAWLLVLQNEAALQGFGELIELTRQRMQVRQALSASFAQLERVLAAAQGLAAQSERLWRSAQTCGIEDVPVNEMAMQVGALTQALREGRAAIQMLERVAASAGAVVPPTGEGVRELAEAVRYLHTVAASVLAVRAPALYSSEAGPALAELAGRARALREESRQLLEQVRATFEEPAAALMQFSQALRETQPLWRIFSGRYRAAKRFFVGHSRRGWSSAAAAADTLDAWAALNACRQAFAEDAVLRRLAGPQAPGLDTPFEALKGVSEFWQAVRRRWPSLDPLRAPIQRLLLDADAGLLEEATAALPVAALDNVGHIAAIAATGRMEEPLAAPLEALGARLAQLREDCAAVQSVGFDRAVRVSEAPGLLMQLAALSVSDQRAAALAAQLAQPVPPAQEAELLSLQATQAFAAAVLQAPIPPPLRALLLSDRAAQTCTAVKRCVARIDQGVKAYLGKQQVLIDRRGLVASEWARAAHDGSGTMAALHERFVEALEAGPEVLAGWALARHRYDEASQARLGALAEAVWSGQLPAHNAEAVFRLAYYRSLLRAVSAAHPQLPAWTGQWMAGLRQQLVQLDREYLNRSRKALAARLSRREVPAGNGHGLAGEWTERALLEREAAKQKRHLPLRELLRRAGAAATALKPCFMMSPASVAQYLAPGVQAFDLVVIDEASQMRPEEALGSIARGRQAVIVGDPMQLPPTTFFDSAREEPEEEPEEQLDTDTESVLDMALASLRPSRDLRWHYRSRHHSLIAYSNREFYHDRLIVFPSPQERAEHLGVQHVPVANGIYHASLNPAEAEQVVETVSDLMRRYPQSSIGVVAINQPQKELLAERFDRLFAEDDTLEQYRAGWAGTLEEFFVKNLENVQGDERDIIVISTVYGPSAAGGRTAQRFGPINSMVGHRRLNVLFTRAKQRVILVTSLEPEQIVLPPGASAGVRALKGYLEYARSGRLEAGQPSGRSFDSPFEQEVAEVLTRLGYEATPQIGVAGFFIDLGVRHPVQREHFMLGIECDGASYHSAKCARDRDRLRQEILERLGWKLYRIWSTDWFQARDREIRRLSEHLGQLCATATGAQESAAAVRLVAGGSRHDPRR